MTGRVNACDMVWKLTGKSEILDSEDVDVDLLEICVQ